TAHRERLPGRAPTATRDLAMRLDVVQRGVRMAPLLGLHAPRALREGHGLRNPSRPAVSVASAVAGRSRGLTRLAQWSRAHPAEGFRSALGSRSPRAVLSVNPTSFSS